MHTNFDKCPLSNSNYIIKTLNPDSISYTDDLFGCIGEYKRPIDTEIFIEKVKKVINDDKIRFYINNSKIDKVCCIAGAGGRDEDFFLQYGQAYDIIITSEVKYSVTLISKIRKFSLIECGHRQSEIFFEKIVYDCLKNSGILDTSNIIIYDKDL
jgi:putative NIF3 family GTP cyclohydrolase 1 type 2